MAIADLRADLAEQTASEVPGTLDTHVVALRTDVANLVECEKMKSVSCRPLGKSMSDQQCRMGRTQTLPQTTPDFWEKIIVINYRSGSILVMLC